MMSVPTRATSAASEPMPRSPSWRRTRPRSRSDPVPYLRTASLHAPNKPDHERELADEERHDRPGGRPERDCHQDHADREHLAADESRHREPAATRRLRAIATWREPPTVRVGNRGPDVGRPHLTVPPPPERLPLGIGIPAGRSGHRGGLIQGRTGKTGRGVGRCPPPAPERSSRQCRAGSRPARPRRRGVTRNRERSSRPLDVDAGVVEEPTKGVPRISRPVREVVGNRCSGLRHDRSRA